MSLIILNADVQAAMRERERREDIFRQLAEKKRQLAPRIAAMRRSQMGFFAMPAGLGTARPAAGGGGGSDPDWASVVLRSTFDTTFADLSPAANTYTVAGGAAISSSQSKWGGASAYFDGAGDEAYTGTVAGNSPGTGNYAIEAWVYPEDQIKQFPAVVSIAGGSNNSYLQHDHQLSTNRFSYATASGTRIGSGTQNFGSWYFVQVIRTSGTTKIYVDATETGSASESATFGVSASFRIGGYAALSADLSFKGFIDDLRISKVARTVAVPTGAFPTS